MSTLSPMAGATCRRCWRGECCAPRLAPSIDAGSGRRQIQCTHENGHIRRGVAMTADGKGLREHVERLRSLSFGIGAYRPPSEGGSGSLLLRVSENCPWNRCTFCEMYKGQRFVYRPVAEITADIDRVAAMRDELAAVS